MKTNTPSPDYKGYRFPSEIISHAVWLYFHFSLSFRDVEELLAQRGIVVTYETVRQWCLKFGQTYANELRRRRPRCGDTWHLDEMVLTIGGKKQYALGGLTIGILLIASHFHPILVGIRSSAYSGRHVFAFL